MKIIFSNAENSRVLVFSPFLFFNLSLPPYPSYFALLSPVIDAAAHWYPGFLYQHQPWRLHWLCKVSIWKIYYKDTARLFCLFAWGFFIMFRTQVLKCDGEDPSCRVPNTQDHALSQHPQCWTLSQLPGSLQPVHKPGFTEAGAYVLVWNHTYFRTTEMDIGGLSTSLLMRTLGAVIPCETVLLRIMDVTEI